MALAIQHSTFQEEELEEDPERLGLHVDDRLNVAEEDGRIMVRDRLGILIR